MAQTLVTVRIHSHLGSAAVEALADTDATFTKIPRAVAQGTCLQAGYEAPVQLGEGRTITRPLALAKVGLDGIRSPVLVTIAQDGEQPLVGYTTLDTLGFKVNAVTHALETTPAIEYRTRFKGLWWRASTGSG